MTTIRSIRALILSALLLFAATALAGVGAGRIDSLPVPAAPVHGAGAPVFPAESDATPLSVCLWNGDQPMENVLVQINGNAHHLFVLPTGNCAIFGQSLASSGSFTVTPIKDDQHLLGVSTYDLIRIARHIQNIEPLQESWQWVAADVNRSNTITDFDLLQLRQLMLGIVPELPDNQSWRFFNAAFVFPVLNPLEEPLPEAVEMQLEPEQTPVSLSFQGVKIGDVSGDTRTGVPSGKQLPPPALALPVAEFPEGASIELRLALDEADDYLGFQCALYVDPHALEIEQLQAGSVPDLAIGRPAPGLITMTWFDVFPRALTPETPLLHIRLKARKPVRLSDALRIETSQLAAEAYDARERLAPLSLRLLETTKRELVADPNIPVFLDTLLLPDTPHPVSGEEEG